MSATSADALRPDMDARDARFSPRLGRRRALGAVFVVVCAGLSLAAVFVLAFLLVTVIQEGGALLTWKFLSQLPSMLAPLDSGIRPALVGSIWIMAITSIAAIPLGVGAAVYLEEYAPDNWFMRMVSINIANLAGVPSIVYGILGLVLFVRWMEFDRSVLSGGLTLALLVLPVIIIASREALRAVPASIRQAAYGLGATRWDVVRSHVLPAAMPGIMTGVILALSRAIGETAPLVMIGGLAYIVDVPGEWYEADPDSGAIVNAAGWLKEASLSEFTAIPLQAYDWLGEPGEDFHKLAAAAILVLLSLLFTLNGIAVGLRAWQQKRLS